MFNHNSLIIDYQILIYKYVILNIMWIKYLKHEITFDDYYNDYNNYYMKMIRYHNWIIGIS